MYVFMYWSSLPTGNFYLVIILSYQTVSVNHKIYFYLIFWKLNDMLYIWKKLLEG
nr:MAG TPA: hypothetical protein [Caudoviricetes sp.]